MTQPLSDRPTRVINVQGRDITVKQLVDAQLLLIAREAKILQRPDVDFAKKLDSVDRMFAILESVVDAEEDRRYLDDLMVRGELDMKGLISFVTEFEPPADAPKVRRGRVVKS